MDNMDGCGASRGESDLVEVKECSDLRIYVRVIGNIVSEVGHRRAVEGGDPHCVDSESGNVISFQSNSSEIPNAIAIGVIEGSGINLGKQKK
jgi:hypothetical protein